MTARMDARDSGLGLVEVIVTVVITGVILIGIAAVLVNSWRAQGEVTALSSATDRGQLLSAAIERAVRNALYVEIGGGGTVLLVSTSLDGELRCQGFRITDGEDGGGYFSANATTLPSPENWTLWHSGTRTDGTAPFRAGADPRVLEYSFQLETRSAPVRLAGEATPRSIQEGGNASCW